MAPISRIRAVLASSPVVSVSRATASSEMSGVEWVVPAIEPARRDLGPVGLAQPIADAGLGQDQPRLAGIGLELGAQLPDIDAQILGLARLGGSPDLAQKLLVRNHAASVAHQQTQQVVFLGRQPDLAPVQRDVALDQVDAERAA